MGKFEFKLPDIGEGVVEGEIVEWMVAVGDTVKEDDPILSVMTDKATVEIPAPCDGTVASIVGEAGDILPVGGVCIVFDVDGAWCARRPPGAYVSRAPPRLKVKPAWRCSTTPMLSVSGSSFVGATRCSPWSCATRSSAVLPALKGTDGRGAVERGGWIES